MKLLAGLLITAAVCCADSGERLGVVHFATSCSPAVADSFNRGVALLHDFWYEEAHKQFKEISKADPTCAMAHWGVAMSTFHQIWDRPDHETLAHGWKELRKTRPSRASSDRERQYVAALRAFFQPGQQTFETRVQLYASAMEELYKRYADDEDAGAFYALALLAASDPADTSLKNARQALAVLTPLFEKNAGHPGLAHYIIHACDTPLLAAQGLHAAQLYGDIAASAPHAVHMPGHIFARLGMWQEDIQANLLSVAASEAAEARHLSGAFDQLHADDFLLYAYLQSGQDGNAKSLMDKTAALLTRMEGMPHMAMHGMDGMFAAYRNEFPAIYFLEMRDWKAALSLAPAAGSQVDAQMVTYWARTIAAGHLRQPEAARANLTKVNSLREEMKKGKNAYQADSTFARIVAGELSAWVAFAEGKQEEALKQMRQSADLQDQVGQGEVDIPAREMLADMLLEYGQPQKALEEYTVALKMSPNRFNGLYNAGRAAEAAGESAKAREYYSQLMKTTQGGTQSSRPEFAHIAQNTSALR